MNKQQQHEIMRKMATMKYIVTDHGTIDLSRSIELQVDIGNLISRHYKKLAKDDGQLQISFDEPEKPQQKQQQTTPVDKSKNPR